VYITALNRQGVPVDHSFLKELNKYRNNVRSKKSWVR
jgi:hypothetical protein